MSDVLARICADKHDHIRLSKSIQPLSALEDAARRATPPRGFAKRLAARVANRGFGLIAEIKKASPSRGLIRADFDPEILAGAYEGGGATCLSVLTDAPYFQGCDAYLTQARGAASLPVLRKDFMLDPYQIVESRALGADCVLLIMAAIDDGAAAEMAEVARSWRMDVLVETHSAAEIERALRLDARLIGINNRDLTTLSVDLTTTEALAAMIPDGRILVCESGLNSRADLDRMAKAGARCFLIGEALMRQPDVGAAVRALLDPTPIQA